jgi:hypothetical protein
MVGRKTTFWLKFAVRSPSFWLTNQRETRNLKLRTIRKLLTNRRPVDDLMKAKSRFREGVPWRSMDIRLSTATDM